MKEEIECDSPVTDTEMCIFYSYNGEYVSFGTIYSGAKVIIDDGNDSIYSKLPFRIIVKVADSDGDSPDPDYFYVDVDTNQNVSLSK
jgi:hypothetical protein